MTGKKFYAKTRTGAIKLRSWIIINIFYQARTAMGIHGLPKLPPGPTMPDPLRPAGRPPPKRPFCSGQPAGQAACGSLQPPWIPHAIWACVFDTSLGMDGMDDNK
jgi:hypothetical protein